MPDLDHELWELPQALRWREWMRRSDPPDRQHLEDAGVLAGGRSVSDVTRAHGTNLPR